MSTEILSQIEDVLEQIRPALHADGGDVELVEFDDEGFVHLSMMGSCGGCPMSTATLTLGIEAELRRAIPEVEGVITICAPQAFRVPWRPPLVGGVWRSLVARSVRVGEVPGSNPGTPMHSRAQGGQPPPRARGRHRALRPRRRRGRAGPAAHRARWAP